MPFYPFEELLNLSPLPVQPGNGQCLKLEDVGEETVNCICAEVFIHDKSKRIGILAGSKLTSQFDGLIREKSGRWVYLSTINNLVKHILRLSLYCLSDIKFGNSFPYSCNFANSKDSLSIPIASEAIFNAITSRSENLGTTPLLGIFPDSLTKLPDMCLHMFRNFADIVYRLCIR